MKLGLSLIAIAAGIFGIISVVLAVISENNTSALTIVGILLALFFGGFLLLDTKNSLLIISSEGIEYRRSGYTIFAQWKDVKKVELRIRRRHEYVLILHKPIVKSNRLNRVLLNITRADTVLFLNIFEHNWYQKSIGDLIQHHALYVKFPS